MRPERYLVEPLGHVESPLVGLEDAPRQGDEGAPEAWLVFEARVVDGLRDIRAGSRMLVLTWLDRARRDVLAVHPRGDTSRPLTGVFSTRSPDRPNPIGLHEVTVLDIRELRIRVSGLEALNGTPILDIKPVLEPEGQR
jgi:tRNA-Thr(GGU) m(6)t(6)A37 methyltransferase TsaA